MAAVKAATKKVIVHGNDRENDEREIVVGVNGELSQILIGQEVELSNGVISAIKNAYYEIDEHKLDKDGNPTKEKVKRKIARYIVEAV